MTKLERLQALEREEAKRPLGRYYADYRDALFAAAPDLIRVASWAAEIADSSDALDDERWVIVGLCEAVVPLLESEADA